jgi:opacity protein-like surface antigen
MSAVGLNTRTFNPTYLTIGPAGIAPARFDNERYGVFVQAAYHSGETTSAAQSTDVPTKSRVSAPVLMDWTGFHIGGHMGGGWSDDRWSDPFNSTVIAKGIDIAGFGDYTHATGPLASAQVGVDRQTGSWILGVEAEATAAHMRGENTCFTGLGGVDCQHVVNSISTMTGRVGCAWERSLANVKGGAALTNTTYNLFANTLAASLGTCSTSLDTWGWTLGGGIEYALTNHWTTFVEYDHIALLPAASVPFPTVAVINTQAISVRQMVDLFKIGMNYKFDLTALRAMVAEK